MTPQELNRDVKRLITKVNKASGDIYREEVYQEICKEIKRLYYADDNFIAMNKSSVLAMIRLNGMYRVIPFHQFGININL